MNGLKLHQAERWHLALGHILFLALFTLAYIHAVPRVVHVDSAFQVFKWIHGEGIGVEAHRFSAIFPQLLVKLATQFGIRLQGLVVIASVAHVLVPYVIFVVIAHVLRLPWHALAVALAQVLCTRLTFYGIVLEVNYLLCYPILFAAMLDGPLSRSRTPLVLLMVLISLLLVLFAHPVGCIMALFVLLLHWARSTASRSLIYGLALLCVLWPLISRAVFPPTGYEAGLYTATSEGLHAAPRIAELPAWRFLMQHTWQATTHYLILWSGLLALLIILVRRRSWKQLVVCLCALVGYVSLNVFTYHQGETAMMMEKNFLPLAVLVGLPLMLEMGRMTAPGQWGVFAAFVVVFFIQFRGISFAARPARERLARIEQLVLSCQRSGIKKACTSPEMLDREGLNIHWALPFETLLLSSLRGPENGVTVVSHDACPPSTDGADFSGLIEAGDVCGNGTSYFRLPKGPYGVLSTQE
ncbi:MAG: hypothetical protein JNM62_12340 [Flavobacteriales bacterium]|nr:hypothetical protein [Flavobacteriales bacterium]